MAQIYSRTCMTMLNRAKPRCRQSCQMRSWTIPLFARSPWSSSRSPLRARSEFASADLNCHQCQSFVSIPTSHDSFCGDHRGTSDPLSTGNPLWRHPDDTIYALSTASGRAAIAVIRVSGPACADIYSALCPNQALPPVQRASVRTLYDPSSPRGPDAILDANALVLLFRAPKTATGEDVLELHVHGGLAVVHAVLRAISQCDTRLGKVRHAEPGEFTRRAFFNGRLDLTQVEALGDILSAATEQQRKLSLRSTGKRLAVQYEQWRAQLLLARGELEALIDFSEDQHFEESPIDLLSSVTSQILKLKQHLHMHLQNATRGEMLRSGLRVALLGVPNAGKSSLLNGIVGRDAAIVSREAGTTRDIVEIGLDIGGYLCRFGDMAGLRPVTGTCGMLELPSPVEIEGMNRAREWTLESDIVLVVVPVPQDPTNGEQSYFNSEVLEVVSECYRRNICILGVMNKVDLLDGKDPTVTTRARRSLREQFQLFGISTNTTFETSCIQRDHQGVEQLKVGIKNACKGLTTLPTARSRDVPNALQDIIGASERHRSLLNQCLFHIDRFLGESVSVRQFNDRPPEQGDIVLAAEALREAADCLAKILGHGYVNDVDEVLGVVFDKFCVGK